MRDRAVPGGEPITAVEVDLHGFLILAHAAALALADWHDARGPHGRLGPEAFVRTGSGGIELVSPDRIAAAVPPFVAPEQLGPARRLDERSDLYAAGAVLRELHRLRLPDLPAVLERIVLRLLAEQPEDRYGTARGLAADLDRCRISLADVGQIGAFPLGAWDSGDRLVVSERLYGRQQRLGRLHTTFDQVITDGRSRLVCITGERGIGKSALAAALAGTVAGSGGRMLSGGFDRYRGAVPYTAFVRLLAPELEAASVPAASGAALAEALGPVARGVVDRLPALGVVLGEPSMSDVLPLAADRRLRAAVARLLGDLAQPRAPVVLLLDDLHWADADSLRLLTDFLLDPGVRHVLVIGTYRPQEVRADHPLHAVHARLAEQRCVAIMTLRPLPDAALTELLADTLGTGATEVGPLTRVVAAKTGGNPLYVGQFLHWLRERDLLRYRQRWIWDLDGIRDTTPPTALAALVAERLAGFEPPVRHVLGSAALLAEEFDVPLLSTVAGQPPDSVEASVRFAAREHLLVREPSSVHGYRWRNEALRHAALAHVPEREVPARHRRIAAALPAARPGAALFETVAHLDAAGVRSVSTAERLRLATLNLTAGREANRIGAIHAARGYFAHGVRALPAATSSRSTSDRYQLEMDLFSEAARAEGRIGQPARARQLLDAAMDRARDDLDRARLLRLRIALADPPRRWESAAEPGLRALRMLGIDLPGPSDTVAAAADRASATARRRLTDDDTAPAAMTDPRVRLAADLIADLLPIARDEIEWHALLAATGVELALDHGGCSAAGVAFAHFGAYVLGRRPDDQPGVARCLHTALRLANKQPADEQPADEHRASALLPVAAALSTWHGPPEVPLELFRQVYRAGIECDDPWQAVAGRIEYCQHLLAAGIPLDRLADEIDDLRGVLRRIGHDAPVPDLDAVEATVHRLRGSPIEVDEPGTAAIPGQIMAAYLFGDFVEALRLCQSHESRALRAESTFLASERYFYQALSLAALHDGASQAQQRAWAAKLDRLHGPLDEWAARGAATFGHKALLVSAERARLAGDTAYAMGRLDRAIGQAREFGFAHIEAIAAEVAGRYASQRGDRIEAIAYLKRAQSCYARWGARSKADEVGSVLAAIGPSETPASLVDRLDLIAVLKAGRAIAGELELEKILATLLELLVQHAGAERGCLVLPDRGVLRVAAAADSEDAGIAITHVPAGPLEHRVPAAIVRYVHRTRELVAGGATIRTFADDPYLRRHRPASLLCAPIVRRDRLVAILYLEHRVLTDAFTAEHLDVLEVLCAQAAVSLENAEMYARLAEANRLLDATVTVLPLGLIVFNADQTVRRASARAEELYGQPLPPGTALASLTDEVLARAGMKPLLDESGAVIGMVLR